jgi:NADPH-dependent FMN reductase
MYVRHPADAIKLYFSQRLLQPHSRTTGRKFRAIIARVLKSNLLETADLFAIFGASQKFCQPEPPQWSNSTFSVYPEACAAPPITPRCFAAFGIRSRRGRCSRFFRCMDYRSTTRTTMPGTPLNPVRTLRSAIEASDGVIMISPEYNHGMSGVLKNAFDWAFRPMDFRY